MNKITDEILTQNLDGELDENSLAELKELLENNRYALNKLKALRLAEFHLRSLETDKAPSDFTERFSRLFLEKLNRLKPKVSYFFVTMLTLFAAAITAVIGFAINFLSKENNSGSFLNVYKDKVEDFIKTNLTPFQNFIKGSDIMYIGTALSVLLLITAYFIFESHKNLKNKINELTR